jgi:hypothetical protein
LAGGNKSSLSFRRNHYNKFPRMTIRSTKNNSMTKIFVRAIILFGTFLLVQCDSSTEKENITSNVKPLKDTSSIKDNIDIGTEISEQSEITCPKCGHKKMESLPTDVCLIKYNCEKCNATLHPKDNDCCVFCSYGTHKCPSKQNNSQ